MQCSGTVSVSPCVITHNHYPLYIHTPRQCLWHRCGGVLNVVRAHCELPVSFFSRQLRGAELNYSASKKEALAIFCAVHHFEHFLYGSSFTVYTDHQPLVYLLSSKKLNKRFMGSALNLTITTSQLFTGRGKKMQTPCLAKHWDSQNPQLPHQD